jgi:hypothetical protein
MDAHVSVEKNTSYTLRYKNKEHFKKVRELEEGGEEE